MPLLVALYIGSLRNMSVPQLSLQGSSGERAFNQESRLLESLGEGQIGQQTHRVAHGPQDDQFWRTGVTHFRKLLFAFDFLLPEMNSFSTKGNLIIQYLQTVYDCLAPL